MLKKANGWTQIIKRLSYFDLLVVGVTVALVAVFFVFFFRKADYLVVRVKVTNRNVLYSKSAPPAWFVYSLRRGMKELDGLGRVSAEIQDVYFYDEYQADKVAYVTLRLMATYSSRTRDYKYKGTPLVVGESLRVSMGKVLVEGLITDIEGLPSPYQVEDVTIEAMVVDESGNAFSETTGVDQYVADALVVGDRVYDSRGEEVVEILEKRVLPARKNTFDDRGNVYERLDPRRKDVYLKLRLRAKRVANELYFFDDVRIRVWTYIPLHFEKISIFPVITKVLP